MTEDEIRKVLQEELGNIAPEMDIEKLDATADLREALDIDSIDFLNFVAALHKRLGVDVPELDYPRLFTLNGAVSYLAQKLEAARYGQAVLRG